ncbi:MAG: FHA domain-containing protein [Chloroflexi bacterium]|nr:FHA domain-containing protein [Chloroflexota bacterium]
MQETVFAIDCGATNWRLYRVSYKRDGPNVQMLGEPQPSPLTSFVNRRLPAIILLDPEGAKLEGYGDFVKQQIEDEKIRGRIREYFKPCIGAHLEIEPLAHQKRFTHEQALQYTKLLLRAVLLQLQQEKWRGGTFDERVHFTFTFPVHWRYDHDGFILQEFRQTVQNCMPKELRSQIRFISEPESAMLSLHRQGLLADSDKKGVTLIADVGGSTTDLIAGQVNPHTGDLEYARRYGEPHGGGLYDAELAKHYADQLKIPSSALTDDPSAMITLRDYSRQLKEALSRQLLRPGESLHTPKRTITLVMSNGEAFRRVARLDEPIFLGITRHLIADFEYLIENGMQAMGLKNGDVGQVILVGGGSQLFTIVRHLRKRFGDDVVILSDNPDENVVHGTALEYGKSFETHTQRILFSHQQEIEGVPSQDVEWQFVTNTGRSHSLLDGATTLGRKRDNHIWLKDDLVSRFHAEVNANTEEIAITDMGSTNGTFINGKRIKPNQVYPLIPGDKIKIGGTEFTCTRSATILRK